MSVTMFSSCCLTLSVTSLTLLHSSKDVVIRPGPATFADVKFSLQSSSRSKNMGF